MALTEKQKRFANEYLKDLNATAAARRAGYKDPNFGRQMLTKTNVSAYIQKRMQAQQHRTEITQDRVLRELAAIGFARGTDYAKVVASGTIVLTPTDQLSDQQKAAVTGVKETKDGVEIKLADKVKALELLGKHLGLFDRPGNEPSTEDRLADYFSALEDNVKNEPK